MFFNDHNPPNFKVKTMNKEQTYLMNNHLYKE